jgi:hypothetical protein
MPRDAVLFSEIQTLRNWHARILLAFPPAALVFIALRQTVWHKPWGNPPMSNGGVVFLAILLTAVYFRLVTVKLVTVVRAGEIEVGLRGLWKRRRIPLAQVRSADPVTYDAARDFGGYGIRTGSRGAGYVARGNRAVELTTTADRKILIGTQDPETLARKIREARRQLPAA